MKKESKLRNAEWHAFEALRLEAAGNQDEAREHLKDAREQLTNAGLKVPVFVQATEIFAFCAEARLEPEFSK